MGEILGNLQSSIRAIDLFDVGIVAFVVYRVLILIRGTRAMQMLTGLAILGGIFFVSSTTELFTTHWLLSNFFDYLVLIVIVVFQDDLRRVLTQVGRSPFFSSSSELEEREMVYDVSRAAQRLADQRWGALIVIERKTGLKNFIETGSRLDSKVRVELIDSIFEPSSPLHDGAVIISDARVAAAGCFLPLSKQANIDRKFGSRHRAAMGLTEETDAIVVLVSEEKGKIYLAKGGQISSSLSERELRETLISLLEISQGRTRLPRRLRVWLRTTRREEEGT